jgi:hypothetical protein
MPQPTFEAEIYDPGRRWDDASGSTLTSRRLDAPVEMELTGSPPPDPPGLPAYYQSPSPFPRTYHSLAVLLPDGRVLSVGGEPHPGLPNPQYSAEIFRPPYLFHGFRPSITSLPVTQVDHGQVFDIGVNLRADLGHDIEQAGGVVLVRPAALTHHFDNDQRFIELNFTYGTMNGNKWTLHATAPSKDIAPYGYYMLFVVETGYSGPCSQNDARVPSTARFIWIRPPSGL